MLKKLCISFLILVFLVFCLVNFINFSTRKYIFSDINSLPQTQAGIIFGAGILNNGGLGETVKDRANEAITVFSSGKVQKIIVTGGKDETAPVLKYLTQAGIASSSIILDGKGVDTYSSLYRVKNIFGISSATLVSQSFHLPRAIFIARHLGIDTYGLRADNGSYEIINFLREIPADLKAVYDVTIRRKP